MDLILNKIIYTDFVILFVIGFIVVIIANVCGVNRTPNLIEKILLSCLLFCCALLPILLIIKIWV